MVTHKGGFTLAEMLIAIFVLTLTIAGVLLTFVRCLELAEVSANTNTAMEAVRGRMEMVKESPFSNMEATFDGQTFAVADLNGIGVSYVDPDAADSQLLWITVSVSWQQKNGLIVGEDQNLNGILDPGEDADGNTYLSSPAQLVTAVYNK